MNRIALTLLALIALGCGGVKKADLVGTWSGSYTMSDAALEGATRQARITSGRQDITKELVKQLVESAGTSLTLNGDDTFTTNFGPAVYTGKWSLESRVVTLNIERLNGMTAEEAQAQLKLPAFAVTQMKLPFKLNLSEDGTSLSGSSPDDPGATVSFSKPKGP